MSVTLDKIKEEVKTLTPEELQQVREAIDSLLSETAKPQVTEEEFAQRMGAQGVISRPSSAAAAEAAAEFNNYQPVTIGGKPLSEMIIEERR